MLRIPLALVFFLTAMGFARAEKPALVIQSQSAAALIGEAKAIAKLVGGDTADDFDEWLEETFGDDGLKGLDLSKPLLAYAHLKGPATGAKLILILPITREADFLALLERMELEATPVEGDESLYRIGDAGDDDAQHFRFHKGCAYFALRGTAKDLDAKSLLDGKDLLDETERALVTATLRPGRAGAAFRKSAFEELEKAVEEFAAIPFLTQNLSKAIKEWSEAVLDPAKSGLEEAEEIALRVLREPGAREASVATTVVPRKGTPLAKDLAARQPTPNRFAGLLEWPDSALVLLIQQPAWNSKAREGFVPTLKAFFQFLSTELSPDAAAAIQTIIAGMVAPGKAGQAEFGLALTAPDKSGFGGAAVAFSHVDPAALLKVLMDFAKNPPEEFGEARENFAKALTLNAAKAGDIAIHTVALKTLLSDNAKKTIDEKALIAFAFGKEAMYVTFGPSAVELMQRLVAVKLGAAQAFDLRVNAKKLAEWPRADNDHTKLVARTLGKEDKLEPQVQLGMSGTGELKQRAQLGLPFVAFAREWSQRRVAGGE